MRKKKKRVLFPKRIFIFSIFLVVLIFTFISSFNFKYKNFNNNKSEAFYSAAKDWIYDFANRDIIKNHGVNDFILHNDVIGIDVSRYQGDVNWDLVDTSLIVGKEVTFCFIKATEGSSWVDKYYKKNWLNISNTEIIKGAYHYYKPGVSPTSQINNFTSNVNLEKGDLPPVLDVEEMGSLSKEELQKEVKYILSGFEKNYNVKPVLYTSVSYFNDFFNNDDFSDYYLWISYFSNSKPYTENDSWIIWQKTEKAKITGIKYYVDLNIYKFEIDDFKNILIK